MPKIRDRAPLSKLKKEKKKKADPVEMRTPGQWTTQTSLTKRANLEYIKCYHNSIYEPSVFSAIFRHKQPQNVDLKRLALLK